MSEPHLLLLDEPTEGIQPSIIDAIIDLLKELREERGLSILLVEQNLDFITELSDRVLLLQKGEVTGEVAGAETTNPALIAEFTGFGVATATGVDVASPLVGGSVPSQALSSGGYDGLANPSSITSVRSAPAPPLGPRLHAMTVQRPTHAQLKEIVAEFGMHMSDERIGEFLAIMKETINAYDVVDAMPDFLPSVDYPRTSGHRPSAEENPLNAWYVKTDIKGAPRGPLAGKTIVLKDNVCLAGVPMMNGASTLKGYTPDVDATIVNRILDAGGTIVGKAHCEYFCLSGSSHTNATGHVHNPHKRGYSAGGSSSGSGALVASGDVDMAIGGDQGGSIRMPASFCGCYGMKATHGLVPYTGVMPIENTIDHTGPMTQTVADNALLLEVIAGEDGLDPRQYAPVTDT
ncbi:MAG: amidase family protein, partial [Geminicoccales bacterium]